VCGIVAVLLYPRPRPDDMWQALCAVFACALISNEERGQAATGLAVVQADGHAQVYKQPIRASQFVETQSYRDLMAEVGPTTTLILGHTRLPTQGSPGNPDNNHPIEVGPVLGVHNGHIGNDAELFDRWKLPRRAEVDSEIIFQMLAALSPQSLNGAYLPKVSECLAQMEGQFTFLALDRRCPSHLLVLKHENRSSPEKVDTKISKVRVYSIRRKCHEQDQKNVYERVQTGSAAAAGDQRQERGPDRTGSGGGTRLSVPLKTPVVREG
jgi:glucosamine 6-phosphate synthetase-like amidotransferase/phosphosugar isomerase protein